MILDLFQIYRARRDKSLASKLALRFAQGQLLERATAPLLIVHLCLWILAIVMGAIAVALFITATQVHGAIMIIATIPLILCVVPVWVSLRLKAGLDYIRGLAESYSDSHVDRLFERNADDDHDITGQELSPTLHGASKAP
jgi:hypothetical protein